MSRIWQLWSRRAILISGGVRGNGDELGLSELRDNYVRAQNAYALSWASGNLQVAQSTPGALPLFSPNSFVRLRGCSGR